MRSGGRSMSCVRLGLSNSSPLGAMAELQEMATVLYAHMSRFNDTVDMPQQARFVCEMVTHPGKRVTARVLDHATTVHQWRRLLNTKHTAMLNGRSAKQRRHIAR